MLRPGDITSDMAPYFNDPPIAARCIVGGPFAAAGSAPDGYRVFASRNTRAPSFRLELSGGAAPLPLRIVVTGPDPSHDTPFCMRAFGVYYSTPSPPVITFDSYGAVPPIAAPASYLDQTGHR